MPEVQSASVLALAVRKPKIAAASICTCLHNFKNVRARVHAHACVSVCAHDMYARCIKVCTSWCWAVGVGSRCGACEGVGTTWRRKCVVFICVCVCVCVCVCGGGAL